MSKVIIGVHKGAYTFDASAKTVTISNSVDLTVQEILLIVNQTDGVVIYSPLQPGSGGTISANVITLDFDTTSMADTDELIISLCTTDPQSVTVSKNDKDLFSNQRSANPETVFDVTFENHKQIDLWEAVLTGAATESYLANKGARTLTTSTASGDKAVLVQHGYNQFLEGKEFVISFTSGLGPQKAGLESTIAYGNDLNSFQIRQTATDWIVEIISNVTGTPAVILTANRANWDDPLDGTGVSKVNLDLTKFGRAVIRTQGTTGKTMFGFDIGGEIIIVHTFNRSYAEDTAYLERASLPVRWVLENVGAVASPTTIEIQGCSVIVYGGYDLTGFPFSAGSDIIDRSISSRVAVLSLRIKQLFGPGSKTPRGVIKLSSMQIGVTGNDVFWEIVLQKGHLGEASLGGTPTWNGINRSTVEFALDGTTAPGGEILAQGYAIAEQGNTPGDAVDKLKDIVHNITLNEAGDTSDLVHLVCTPIGPSASIFRALGWTEFK